MPMNSCHEKNILFFWMNLKASDVDNFLEKLISFFVVWYSTSVL